MSEENLNESSNNNNNNEQLQQQQQQHKAGVEQTIWVCGYNDLRQLGSDTETLDIPKKLTFEFPAKIVQIVCGSYFTIFIDEEGHCWACGANSGYQLGLKNSSTCNKPTLIKQIEKEFIINCYCGYGHTIFENLEGKLFAVGTNSNYQIGLKGGNSSNKEIEEIKIINENDENYFKLPLKKIQTGNNYTSIYSRNGNIYFFSLNRSICENHLTTFEIVKKDQVEKSITYGLYQLDLGIFENKKVQDIIGGNHRVHFLMEDGSVYKAVKECKEIQFPFDTKIEKIIKVYDKDMFSIYQTSRNNFYGIGFQIENDNSSGQTSSTSDLIKLTLPFSGRSVTDIYIGGYHVFFIKDNYEVYGCGSNSFGQLGVGSRGRIDRFARITDNQFNSSLEPSTKRIVIANGASHSITFFKEMKNYPIKIKLLQTLKNCNNFNSTEDLFIEKYLSDVTFILLH
ncbi:hypothetical protein ABK040_011531 [Willaertia magna]